jgi:hypothetical protein
MQNVQDPPQLDALRQAAEQASLEDFRKLLPAGTGRNGPASS